MTYKLTIHQYLPNPDFGKDHKCRDSFSYQLGCEMPSAHEKDILGKSLEVVLSEEEFREVKKAVMSVI